MIPFSIKFDRVILNSIHWKFTTSESQPLSNFGLTFDVGTGLWLDTEGDDVEDEDLYKVFELTDEIYFPWLSRMNQIAGKKA